MERVTTQESSLFTSGGTCLALIRNTLARSEFCAAKPVNYFDYFADDKNSVIATRAHAFSAVDRIYICQSSIQIAKPTIKIFLEVGINIKHVIWGLNYKVHVLIHVVQMNPRLAY